MRADTSLIEIMPGVLADVESKRNMQMGHSGAEADIIHAFDAFLQ